MTAAESLENTRLVDLLLAEQESLSAVERFAQRHAHAAGPAQARWYRDLIPATPPAPGQQYAFRVDLDACTGCKACVTACHNLNGLGESETWRDVGLLVGGAADRPLLQTVTTACHHCEDPACLSGCPVRAYEKDPITGIVRHLDDQCIGCQYCVLKCPYDVPKYDVSRGIVRKCDMCGDRLSAGEAPACVQGCPNEAISIALIETGAAPAPLLPLLPGLLPDSGYTRPTTRYVGGPVDARELRPADQAEVAPGAAHTPLSLMLVLSQLAAGTFGLEALLAPFDPAATPARCALGLAAAALGLAVANLHLGRPLYAFRAVLGLGTSWMSREIVVLGAFAGAAALLTASAWLPALTAPLAPLRPALAPFAAGLGLAGVACSIMIYADTRRALWHGARTAPLFLGSTLALGISSGVLAGLLAGATSGWLAGLAGLGAVVVAAKLRFEAGWLAPRDAQEAPALARSAALLRGPLAPLARLRRVLGLAGGVALPVLLALSLLLWPQSPLLPSLAALALAACLAGEWLERHLFFRACAPLAMPGQA
jgi:Fe-S-cluster-containing dehydrogenase component/DMSO reductase anchor subunit